MRTFREWCGIALLVGIQEEPLAGVPLPDGKNDPFIMLWLFPALGQVLLARSPLVRISMGDAFARSLKRERFDGYFATDRRPEGLAGALDALARNWTPYFYPM